MSLRPIGLVSIHPSRQIYRKHGRVCFVHTPLLNDKTAILEHTHSSSWQHTLHTPSLLHSFHSAPLFTHSSTGLSVASLVGGEEQWMMNERRLCESRCIYRGDSLQTSAGYSPYWWARWATFMERSVTLPRDQNLHISIYSGIKVMENPHPEALAWNKSTWNTHPSYHVHRIISTFKRYSATQRKQWYTVMKCIQCICWWRKTEIERRMDRETDGQRGGLHTSYSIWIMASLLSRLASTRVDGTEVETVMTSWVGVYYSTHAMTNKERKAFACRSPHACVRSPSSPSQSVMTLQMRASRKRRRCDVLARRWILSHDRVAFTPG